MIRKTIRINESKETLQGGANRGQGFVPVLIRNDKAVPVVYALHSVFRVIRGDKSN